MLGFQGISWPADSAKEPIYTGNNVLSCVDSVHQLIQYQIPSNCVDFHLYLAYNLNMAECYRDKAELFFKTCLQLALG